MPLSETSARVIGRMAAARGGARSLQEFRSRAEPVSRNIRACQLPLPRHNVVERGNSRPCHPRQAQTGLRA